jgi:hypothetical protein
MKSVHLYFFILLVLLQSCFGSKPNSNNGQGDAYVFSKRVFPPEAIEKLRKTTTVFIYGRESGKTLDSLKEAITSAWDLTPLIFEPIENYGKYAGEQGYSCFIIEGGRMASTFTYTSGPKMGRSFGSSNTHIYLVLRPYDEYGFCRIELYPNTKTMLSRDYDHFTHKAPYMNGYFYNWSPVYLKAHLERVSTNLKKNYLRPDLFENYKHPALSSLLANDTLYVSQELLAKFNPLSGKEKENDEGAFKSYRFPYRLCSNSELYDIFITQKRGRFLFEYVKSSTFKLIKIFDMKSKDLVYAAHKNGYNLKAGDITAIK